MLLKILQHLMHALVVHAHSAVASNIVKISPAANHVPVTTATQAHQLSSNMLVWGGIVSLHVLLLHHCAYVLF